METELERIATKARNEPKLRFTSLAHHITIERLRTNLSQMDKASATGVDGQTVAQVEQNLDWLAKEVIRRIHTQGYHPPPVLRVWIPKPGKSEKRPIGIPTVLDRALQKSTAQTLEAIYEQDFLNGSFGGRPGRSAHHALATLNEIIAGKKVSYLLEADLRNFFDHASWYSYEKRKFLSLPDRSFLNNSSVEGLSGNKYKRVFGSRVICMHPL